MYVILLVFTLPLARWFGSGPWWWLWLLPYLAANVGSAWAGISRSGESASEWTNCWRDSPTISPSWLSNSSRLLKTMVFGLSPVGWTTYAVVGSAVLIVTLLAAFVPAWRASRIDPLTVLRN